MSYVKNTWTAGDVITAEKLNRIEDGVASISLPDIDPTTDAGKVLTVGSDGNLGWATPGQPVDNEQVEGEPVQEPSGK